MSRRCPFALEVFSSASLFADAACISSVDALVRDSASLWTVLCVPMNSLRLLFQHRHGDAIARFGAYVCSAVPCDSTNENFVCALQASILDLAYA